jgi:hypothetical protein
MSAILASFSFTNQQKFHHHSKVSSTYIAGSSHKMVMAQTAGPITTCLITQCNCTNARLQNGKEHISIQKKFSQEAIASSNKPQWQNIQSTWENNKNKPRKQAVANFRLNTGHDCLAAHLRRIKIFNHNYYTICKLENTIMEKDHLPVCPKLDHTSNELPKLYWDARILME